MIFVVATDPPPEREVDVLEVVAASP